MFKLMMVTDRRRSALPLAETVRLAALGGVDAVQLRERDMDGREFHKLADELRKVTRETGVKLLINQRLDIAVAVKADGVHLGWRSLGVHDVHQLGGADMLAGVSCHDAHQIEEAEAAGADYILLGPVFETPSKQGVAEALGIERFKELVAMTKLPVLAIGGVTPENGREVMGAGAAGLAAISALTAAEDPESAARQFKECLSD
jgi:thiamine-phosphate pyrophosphorylase